MKKRFAILRLGSDQPIIGDAVMLVHLADTMIGCPIPGGIITFIQTDATNEDIVNSARAAEEELDDMLPVVVWDLSEDSTSLDNFIHVKETINKFNEMCGEKGSPEVIHMSIDDVLDKINQSGLESLTPAELSLLKRQN